MAFTRFPRNFISRILSAWRNRRDAKPYRRERYVLLEALEPRILLSSAPTISAMPLPAAYGPTPPALVASVTAGTSATQSSTAAIPVYGGTGGTIRILSGTSSFAGVSDSNNIISVAAGAPLSGSLNLDTYNIEPGGDVAPLIYTPSWGNPAASYQTIANLPMQTGNSTETANISLVAPTTPGTYHVIFAFGWEIGGAAVASATQYNVPAVWGDGNDIATLSQSQIQQGQELGYTTDNFFNGSIYFNRYVPLDAITVVVGGYNGPPTNNANLLQNPGFENRLQGWTTSQGTAVYTANAAAPHSGTYDAMGVETNASSLGRLYQNVTGLLVPGAQYTIGGWIKTQDVVGPAGEGAVIALDYVGAGGWTPSDGYVREIGHVEGTTGWTYYTATFTLPAMPTDANGLSFLMDFNDATGTAWFDDLSLTGPAASPVITGVTATPPTTPQSGGWNFTISGSGFGGLSPFSAQDTADLNLVDNTQNFGMGYTGDAVTASVSSWSDSSITISGLAGAYGQGAHVIKPGDQMTLTVVNPATGEVSNQFQFAAPASAPSTNTPIITNIALQALAGDAGNWAMTISGSNLGSQNPFTTGNPDLLITDTTNNMPAGGTGDTVTANVATWTASQIAIQSFGGAYGQRGLVITPGDKLTISVTNPQTGEGTSTTATVPRTAPTVSSVAFAPIANGNWSVTINGSGFGSQSAFSTSTPYLAIEDTTNSLSAAGEGDAITANVTSWQDNQIAISGFGGIYDFLPSLVFNPADPLSFTITNPQTGAAMQAPYVQALPASRQAPAISSAAITTTSTTGVFNVAILGSGFGSMQPFKNGNSAYISLSDGTTGAQAGPSSVTAWSNSEILLSFAQPATGAQFGYGDSVTVTVTNPQSPSLGAATGSAVMPNASLQTTSANENLSLVNQSLWGSSSAGTSFDYFLGPQWNASEGTVSLGPAYIQAGYGAGKVGLDISGGLSAGGVNATYPVDAQLTAARSAAPNSQVTIQTGFSSQGGQATLSTTAPDLGLKVALEAQASFNASIGLNTPWGPTQLTGLSPYVNWTDTLLNLSGVKGKVSLPLGASIGYDLTSDALPTANSTATVSNGMTPLTATGEAGNSFASLSDDLVALAAALAPPPVDGVLGAIDGASWTLPWWAGGGTISYSLLKVILSAGLNLTATETLTPQFQVTLTSNTGQTETGNLGQNFSFTMPQSGPLQLSESLSLAGSDVSTTWGLGANGTIDVPVLQADLLGLKLGPLADFKGTLFDTGTLANIISTGNFAISDNPSVVPAAQISDAISIDETGSGTAASFPLASNSTGTGSLLAAGGSNGMAIGNAATGSDKSGDFSASSGGALAQARTGLAAAAPAATAATATTTAAAQTAYTIQGLGIPSGAASSAAAAINGSSQISGDAAFGSGSSASYEGLLFSGGNYSIIPNLGGAGWLATGINSAGDLTGYGLTSTGQTNAFLYAGGTITALGSLSGPLGQPTSAGTGVDTVGDVVGYSGTNADTTNAFLYLNPAVSTNVMTDLGTLGGTSSAASGISPNGDYIVGYSTTAENQTHAFLWTNGGTGGVSGNPQMQDLQTLGGTTSFATAVNNSGDVVGYSTTGSGTDAHAFYYDGAFHDLGDPSGFGAYATALNNSSTVVGYYYTSASTTTAFIAVDGILVPLNSLLPSNSGWNLEAATGINDSGDIVGYGTNPTGQTEAFELIPTVGAPLLVSAQSLKTQGTAGTFGINLPLTGTPAVEDRINGPTQLVLTFQNPITKGANFSVTPSETSVNIISTSVSGDTLTINLSGATQGQVLTLTANDVQDAATGASGNYGVSVAALYGDVNSNGLVNVADINIVRQASGNAVNSADFRDDLNCNGLINVADINIVRQLSGATLSTSSAASTLSAATTQTAAAPLAVATQNTAAAADTVAVPPTASAVTTSNSLTSVPATATTAASTVAGSAMANSTMATNSTTAVAANTGSGAPAVQNGAGGTPAVQGGPSGTPAVQTPVISAVAWAQTGDGSRGSGEPAMTAATQPSQATPAPQITGVSMQPMVPGSSNWQIIISGTGFGTQSAFTGDSTDLAITDKGRLDAGYTGDAVTANVTSWSNNQIVISGLAGAYGVNGWIIAPGNNVLFDITNPQTGVASSVFSETFA